MTIKELLIRDSNRYATSLMLLLAVGIAIGSNSFFVIWTFLGIGYLFAFHEARKLFGLQNNSIYAYAFLLWLICYVYPEPIHLFFLVAIIFGAILAYRPTFQKELFLPFLYPTASFLFLLTLYKDFGTLALIWLLIAVTMTDITAYYAGKLVGTIPFSQTSPNKTIEGVIAGVIGGTLLGMTIGHMLVSIELALGISFLVSLSAIFGDLFESALKRQAGAKDSGSLFPGHGGVLDRLDGHLFGSVILVIALQGVL
jgi:phosphatidate cytidylyltransferase